ncbi:SDR family NAD(P)-dependent oxidoreductase [Halegenticoccus tardaugens]|uniref:SDR family NAD(P)-dependent oxidoreductase n=1 Tax=Halegenticoccus tardaugens TaxID=2071624 RepID=UPI00100A2CB1|nr:SDR family oxidoreductase [Halegenticoccus tardaugens]
MSGNLKDQTAIVTGSSGGIGRSIAEQFAAEGANVVTNSRSVSRAEKAAAAIEEVGGTALPVEADVSSKSDVERLVEETVTEFGQLDIMVNNAGISHIASAMEMTEEQWRQVINVNLTGVFFGCQVAGEQMIKQGRGGQILNISSIFGSIGVQGRAPYNASKGGVNNLTRCLAIELAEHDIHVNALAPGFIKTALDEQTREERDDHRTDRDVSWPRYGYEDEDIHNRTPLGRFGTLEEMANCATFIAAGDHYMTGEVLHADGGWLAFGWGSKDR